jgi:hypothetical protein
MKKILTYIAFFLCFQSVFSQQDLIVEGNYWGKNIYIFNPIENGKSSISKITVNNVVLDSVFNSNSYVIDFTKMGFSIGQSIIISIQYSLNLEPRITNIEAIAPNKDFSIESFKYSKKDNALTWIIREFEKGKLYDIEQFIWGKWLKVREIGLADTLSSTSFIPLYNSGLNLFRVKQYEKKSKNVAYTKSIKVRPGNKEVVVINPKASKIIEFSDETMFEFNDNKGKVLKTGKGKQINIESFPKGEYWLNYDNKTEAFIKK